MTATATECRAVPELDVGSAEIAATEWALGEPVLGAPLQRLATDMATAHRRMPHLPRAGQDELSEGLVQLGELRAGLERLTVAVLLEAAARGCHLDTGLSLHDWLSSTCPWLPPAEVNDLVAVARELDQPAHTPIRAALADGTLPTRRAARLLRCLRQIRSVTDTETYQRDIEILLPIAQSPRYTDKDLKKVTDHLLGLAVPELAHEAKAKALAELRGVNESTLADGSPARFVITADPEGAAVIRSVLTSPLAAPAPDDDGPDPRTASQRRYDALLAVIRRGVSSPEGAPTTSKARIVITMPFDVLEQRLIGLGHTLTGEALSPGTVRKLACTAEIIPAVLGADSELLDLGRAVRCASPAQHLALWRRDRHCTYPGCTVPPQWCDAHHVDWWSRGGRTDLGRLALLCPRHHTKVHEDEMTAAVEATGVRWHRR